VIVKTIYILGAALMLLGLVACSGDSQCPTGSASVNGVCQIDDPAQTADFQLPDPLDLVTISPADVIDDHQPIPDNGTPDILPAKDNLDEESHSD
jgi:hypothetical protein